MTLNSRKEQQRGTPLRDVRVVSECLWPTSVSDLDEHALLRVCPGVCGRHVLTPAVRPGHHRAAAVSSSHLGSGLTHCAPRCEFVRACVGEWVDVCVGREEGGEQVLLETGTRSAVGAG